MQHLRYDASAHRSVDFFLNISEEILMWDHITSEKMEIFSHIHGQISHV